MNALWLFLLDQSGKAFKNKPFSEQEVLHDRTIHSIRRRAKSVGRGVAEAEGDIRQYRQLRDAGV